MKIIKIFLISIAALIGISVAAAVVFISTFDVNRYKPMIVSQLKTVLNREADFGKASLGFSLQGGVSVRVTDIVIADDPLFHKGAFFAVKDVSLGINVLSYLLQKKVDVSIISIRSPYVTIIRSKDGQLNVMSLAKVGKEKRGAAVSGPALMPAGLPALLVASLEVEGGTLLYEDRSFDPALKVEVSDLRVSVNKISLTQSFPFVIEGTVLSAKKNIKLEGRAQIDLATNAVTISDFKTSTDLSDLILEKIPVVFSMVRGATLPTKLKGKADVTADKVMASPAGLTGLTADLALTKGEAQFKELALPIKDISAQAKMTLSKAAIESVSAGIGDGTIKASGNIEDYLVSQNYDGTFEAKNLKIQDLATQEKVQVKVEGIVSGQVKVKGKGFSSEAISSTLSGEGQISGKEIKLKNINVLRTVLDKIGVIPGLSEKMQESLPDKYKQKLTETDTALSDVNLPFTIENGRVLFKDVMISGDGFMFRGQAESSFDGSFSTEGSFLIPQDLSAAMVAGAPQLQYLLNVDKQIYIPLKVSGRASNMKFDVDAAYMTRKLVENQAQTQFIKAINKAIGVPNQDASAAAGTAGQGASSGSSQGSAAEDIVNGIFGGLFKK